MKLRRLLSLILAFRAVGTLAWDEQRYQSIRQSLVSYFANHKTEEFGIIAKDSKHNELAEAIAREFESKDDDQIDQLFDRIQILIKWRYLEPKGNFANVISSDDVDYQLIYFAFLTLVVKSGSRIFEKVILSSNNAQIYSESGIDPKAFNILVTQRNEDLKLLALEKKKKELTPPDQNLVVK